MNSYLIEKRKEAIPVRKQATREEIERMVEKAMHGNRIALAELCQTIARGVLFRLSYKLKNRADAEDATQEVLIRVCESIH